MTLNAANSVTQMAGGLIQTVMGDAFRAEMDLAQKMLKVTMSMNLQSPSTADVNGLGGMIDVVG